MGSDPTDPIRTALLASATYQLTPQLAESLMTHHAYLSNDAWQIAIDKSVESNGVFTRIAATTNSDNFVLRDLVFGNLKLTATGDDETGYSVVEQTLGNSPQNLYVVREDGKYRSVASQLDTYEVGGYVLYLLEQKRYSAARALLNWHRDQVKRGESDDALAGPLFPRFWKPTTSVADATPDAMRLAAVSLLASSPDVKPELPFAAAALAAIKPDEPHAEQRRTALNLLLARGYVETGQPAPAHAAANALLLEEPDSATAVTLAGEVYGIEKDFGGWNALLAPRLAAKPSDRDLLLAESRMFSSQGDYKSARMTERKILDSGRSTDADYNSYAWLGLFANDLGAETTDAAQHGSTQSKSSNFDTLHTMASIYAAQGKITEAREVLLQALTASHLDKPNSAAWYVIGVMDRQLGLNDAALAALHKVKAPTYALSPVSTWALAQREIAAVKSAP